MIDIMHIGIDLHGTIDHNITFFYDFMEKLVQEKHTVSVVSGSPLLKILKELNALGLQKNTHYHNIYSVQDFLHIKNHVSFVAKFNQNKQEKRTCYTTELWYATKATLCNLHKVNVFIDNEMKYLKYFSDTYYQNGCKIYLYDENDKFAHTALMDFLEKENMQ